MLAARGGGDLAASSNKGVGGGGKSGVWHVTGGAADVVAMPFTGLGGGGKLDACTSWMGWVIWPKDEAGGCTTMWCMVESGDARPLLEAACELVGIFLRKVSDWTEIPDVDTTVKDGSEVSMLLNRE